MDGPREAKMKICLRAVLVWVALGFILPAFAQQKDVVDAQIVEQLNALGKKTNEALNNGDASALAALYTEDAVLVTGTGPIYGREAIEKYYARLFQHIRFTNHAGEPDQYSPHIIGTGGDEVWSNGEWNHTLQGHGVGTVKQKGYWASIAVREGNTWKVRLDFSNWNVVPGTPGNH
jgi:ketosteroid isomerase-like protein